MNRTHNRYCRGDRRRGTPFSRYGRGFTTIELAVSLALFLFLSVFISLAVSRALSTTAEARAVRGAEAVAADVLSQVETAPYPELVAGTFSVPDPCAGNTATGIQATTCTKMGNVDVVLSYQYVDVPTGTTTPVCSSTTTTGTRTATAYGYVGLCASVTSIAGSPAPDTLAPVMKRVNAPSPKFAPDGGVVRVTVGGDTSLLPSQTLYLVKENDPSHIMGSGQIASDHIAYISTFGAEANTADTAACTTASPCMLVATPINGGAASPAVSGAGALYGSAARPGARISTPTGIVRDVGVTVGGLSTLRMDATARNGDTVARATPSAQDGIPSITNTICLWATFDDNGTHSSQICNSNPSNPGLLSASTYRNGANLWPLPATNVTVTTDHPSGRCLAGEQTGYVPGGNGSTAPGSVCTSWTWGVPSTLPATVALNPGSTTRLPVMWTASENGQGAPAAGWPNSNSTNLWAHPRAMPGCAETGTCSTVTTAPELTWCPQGFCRTGRNDLPVLISPTGPVVRAVGDARPIEASALNRAGNGMYVYQMPSGSGSAVVPNGTLTANGSSVSSGELIGSTSTSDLSRFSYVYNRPVGYNNAVDVRVRLCPAPSGTPGTCANGATRTITITAAQADGVLTLDDASGIQGGSATLTAVLSDPLTGAGKAGVAVTFNLGGAATAVNGTAIATTDSSGIARLPIMIAATAGATNTITATSGGSGPVTDTATLTVTPVAASLSMQVPTLPVWAQNGSNTVTITARSAANTLVANAPVSLVVAGPNSSATATGVYPQTGCTTNNNGVCSIVVKVTRSAPAGSYTLNASSAGAVTSGTITVVSALDRVTFTPTPALTQGSINVSHTMTAYDTDGAVLPNTAFTVTGDKKVGPTVPHAPFTNPLSTTVTTNSNGQAEVNLSAAISAVVGTHDLTISQILQGWTTNPSTTVAVEVANSSATITTANVPTVAQLGTGTLVVNVTDSSGQALAGKIVYASSANPSLQVNSNVVTDASGNASFTLNAQADVPAGQTTVEVWVAGQPPISVPIQITATPDTVSLVGDIAQGQSGTVTTTVYDTAGAPITGIAVSLVGFTNALTITPPQGTTTNTGAVQFTVADSSAFPSRAGSYTGTVRVGANTDFPAAIVITSRPQTITSPTSGPLLTSSSETDSAVYTVSDAAGDPVTNYPVTLSWVGTNPGPIATIDGVEVTNEGMTATTSDTGMVTVNAAATSTSLFGNYTLLLTAGPLTTTRTVSVTQSVPGMPIGVSATASNQQVDVTWTPPLGDGGSPITGYTATLTNVTSGAVAGTCTQTTVTKCMFTGLTNGTPYVASVTASNILGVGAAGESEEVTPVSIPGAPQNVAGTPGDKHLTSTWAPPASNGGTPVTGYTATAKPASVFRTNLVTNPSFTADKVGWFGAASTRVTTQNAVGTTPGALQFTSDGTAPYVYPVSKNTNIVAGARYTASARMRAAATVTGPRRAQIKINYYNGGSYLGSDSSNSTTLSNSGWTTYSYTTPRDTPAGTNRLEVYYLVDSSGTGNLPTTDLFYLDGALTEQATTTGTYFDGTTPGAQWTGTANDSTSILDTSVRTNLLPNPTFASNGAGWTLATPPMTATTTNGAGPGGANVFTIAPGTASVHNSGVRVLNVPVIGSNSYTYTAAVRASTPKNMYISLRWYDHTGTQLSESNTPISVAASSEWALRSITASAPATAVTATATVSQLGVTLGDTYEVSAPSIIPGGTTQTDVSTYATDTYFDGGSASSQWLGAQDNSVSARTVGTFPTCTTTDLTCTITGLANGSTYRTSTSATNAVGIGNPSPWTAPVTLLPDPPGAPTNVAVARVGNTTSTFTWAPPTTDGGAQITNYLLTVTNGATTAGTCSTSTLTCSVSGLTNGTTYSASVVATNSRGMGAGSSTVTFTPRTIASTPQTTLATAGHQQIANTWTAPASNGGTPVTGYTATAKPNSVFRTNQATNPSFVGNTGGWVGYTGGSASYVTSGSSPASTSNTPTGTLRMTSTTTGSAALRSSFVGENPMTALPSTNYTFSADVSTPNANQTVYATLQWRNSAGTVVGSAQTNQAAVTVGGTPQRITLANTSPADTAYATVIVQTVTSASGDIIDIDDILLTQTASGTTYFDGATPGAQWTGAANNSVSILDTSVSINGVKNPSFETDTSSWTNHSAPIIWSDEQAYSGYFSGKIVTTSGTRLSVSTGASAGVQSSRTPVISGQTYTYRSYMRASAGSNMTGIALYVYFYNAAGAQLGSNIAGPATTVTSTGWTPVTHTVTAPAGATTTAMLLYQESTTGGSTFYIDGNSIGTGGVGDTYFDGSSANSAWLGTQNNSMSQRTTGTFPTCTTTTLTCTITGLANGTAYRTSIGATNNAGGGNPSEWSTAVTPLPDPPGAPTALGITQVGNTNTTFTWAPPATDGGAPVTNYLLTVTNGATTAGTCSTSTLTCTVTGLANGMTYSASVAATNSRGMGAGSSTVTFTPRTIASTPQTTAATAGNQQVTNTWTAPASTGGTPVTGYTATVKPASAFRTNLVTNPSFTTNTTGWPGIAERIVTDNVTGNPAGAGRFTGTGASYTYPYTRVAITGSTKYTASAWMRKDPAITETRNAYIAYEYYDSNNQHLPPNVNGTPVALPSTWTRISYTPSIPAPANAAWISVKFMVEKTGTAIPTTDNFYIDGALVEEGTTVGSYFDGATPGAQWTGAANNSAAILDTSIRVNNVYNPSFETNDSRWTKHGGITGGPSTDYAYAGNKSLKLTIEPGQRLSLSTGYGNPADRLPINPNTSYTYTAQVRSLPNPGSGYGDVRIYVYYYDGTGTVIGAGVPGSASTVNSTGWTPVTTTQIAPANAVAAAIDVYQSSSVGNSTFYVDGVIVENSATASTYFDGGVNDGQWSGAQDNSYSTKNITTPATCTTTGLTCTITGLVNGTGYRTSTSATNAAGVGNPSPWTSVTTPSPQPPGAPGAPTAAVGNQQVALTWTAPTDNGGSPITNYVATVYNGATTAGTCFTSALTCTVTGLINATTYTASVTATNLYGTSPASNASTTFVPLTIATSPQNVLTNAGNTAITSTWAPPASNGGTPVTGYTATAKPASVFRTNLVTNPSFTTNITGWVGPGATRVTTENAVGTPPGALQFTGSGNYFYTYPATTSYNIAAGARYTASARMKADSAVTGGRRVQIKINYYNGTTYLDSDSYTSPTALSNSGWTTYSYTTPRDTPAGTNRLVVYYLVMSNDYALIPTTESYYLDGALTEQGTTTGTYFDGITPGGQWTGTANDSTSILDTTVRVNMLTNPGGESGIATPWENGNNSVITATTLPGAPYGTQVLKQTTNSAGLAVMRTPVGTAGVPVESGSTYTFSGYVKLDSGAFDTYARIRWYDLTGTEIPASASTSSLTPGGTSFTRVVVTGIAPSTAMYASVQGLVSVDAAAHDTYWDGLMLEKSATAGAFFDGNTPGSQWVGAQDNSMSTQTIGTFPTCTTSTLTCTLTGLTNNDAYRMSVTGTNAVGVGNPSPWTATTVVAPVTAIPGNILWLDATARSTITTTSNNTTNDVNVWGDKSGLNNNAVALAGNATLSGTINGRTATTYGGNQELRVPAGPYLQNSAGGTIFAVFNGTVMNPASPTTTRGIVSVLTNTSTSARASLTVNGTGGDGALTAGGRRLDTDSYQSTFVNGLLDNTTVVSSATYNFAGAALNLTANANTATREPFQTTGLTENTTSNGIRIGYASAGFNGRIGEIIIYDRVLTETERNTVTAYLTKKWATP